MRAGESQQVKFLLSQPPCRGAQISRFGRILVEAEQLGCHVLSTAEGLGPSSWVGVFGLVLVEAMACGTPVTGSDLGGIPSVIGDAGLLVKPGDDAQLASAIASVLDNSRLGADLSARGRNRVLSEFTWERTARRFAEAYARGSKSAADH